MMMIGLNAWNAIKDATKSTPGAVIKGGVLGYGYAKYTHLPPIQVAKAWAIWVAASHVLTNLVTDRFEKSTPRLMARVIMLNISTAIGVQQLQQMGLMGGKMRMLFIAIAISVTAGACLILFSKSEMKQAVNKIFENYKNEAQTQIDKLNNEKATNNSFNENEKIEELKKQLIGYSEIESFINKHFFD